MSKARGNPEHAFVLTGKPNTLPLAEGRRLSPQVYDHIHDLAHHHSNKFSLGTLNLIMQAAHHVASGVRMIILDETFADPNLLHRGLVVAFEEETALVPKYPGFQNQRSLQRGFYRRFTRSQCRTPSRILGRAEVGASMRRMRCTS